MAQYYKMENRKFEDVIKNFYTYLKENKQEYLLLFSRLQIQIEGWFRGELMNYLDQPKNDMSYKNREVPLNDDEKGKVDLKIQFNDEIYWIELKHILVGYQIKTPISLGFYFTKDQYVDGDFEKFKKIKKSVKTQYGYSLVFISTNYIKEGSEKSKIDKIDTKEKLKYKFEDIKNATNHSNLSENNSSLTSYEYDNELHFGYLLMNVKIKDNL